jgi:uncharacterized protein YjdB
MTHALSAFQIGMRARVRRVLLSVSLLFAVPLLTHCGTVVSDPVPVATVALSTTTASLAVGSTLGLSVTLKDAAGQTVTGQPVTWSSNNTAVATVSRAGVVTALSPGDARIAVSAFGKSATAQITVTARPVASVVVTPAVVSLQTGATTTLQARPLDSDGNALTGRTVTWASGNPAIATVSAAGVVTGVALGATAITATVEGRVAQVAVTVTLPPVATVAVTPTRDTLAVGGSRQFTVVTRDAQGAALTGRTIAWSSSNVAIATVSSTGSVAALAPGTVTITATSEGRTGTATVVVLARLASAVIVSPATGTLVVGSTQALTTQVTDEQGNLLTGRPVTYSADVPSVATVSAAGVVTALAPGTVRITATSEGRTGSATFTVIPVPVSAVQVTPATGTIVPGATLQLSAVARSAAGAVLTGRTVTWVSGAPSIATVNANGLVTAVANGVVVIFATIDGVTATGTITVAPPPVATIELTPANASIAAGETVQLSATLRDAASTVLSGRTITWSSADEAIAFVSSSGLVVGFKSGTVRITATSEGVSVSTLVTVR